MGPSTMQDKEYVELITREHLSVPNDILPHHWGVAVAYVDQWHVSCTFEDSLDAFKEANAELELTDRNYHVAIIVPSIDGETTPPEVK